MFPYVQKSECSDTNIFNTNTDMLTALIANHDDTQR